MYLFSVHRAQRVTAYLPYSPKPLLIVLYTAKKSFFVFTAFYAFYGVGPRIALFCRIFRQSVILCLSLVTKY